MAMVQLRLGDMFDGPSDMLVLPCATDGSVTGFVEQRLYHHRIPHPQYGMELGDVQIMPFVGGENIAQFVAYAASVEARTSSEAAIRRIGEQLGAATSHQSTIRLISAPLLGAGAGRLPSGAVVEALATGFKSTAHQDARLVIHVLHRELFDRLSTEIALERPPSSQEQPPQALRVFISYSHTSDDHQEWVRQLGTFLRLSGIDARLDVWHLRPGMDLPQFMANELSLAERVILVSDEKYAEKADGRLGGVGWETMLIQGDMARLPGDSTKYMVIVRSNNLDAGVPMYLRTKFAIHWADPARDEQNRQTLLRELYDRVDVPPIGPRLVFI
jgi:hypothetical protein